MSSTLEELKEKILVLNTQLWENKKTWPQIQQWLDNFTGQVSTREGEQLHALYLLSHFLYFGSREIRELLRSLFQDLVLYPILSEIRVKMANGTSLDSFKQAVTNELQNTRFLGVGNPSESGCHLLYFFRQENQLPKDLFCETHKIFQRGTGGARSAREPTVTRYVFIDDLCGSGTQAEGYSCDLMEEINNLAPNAKTYYFPLFATFGGLDHVRRNTKFSGVDTVFELDQSYKLFARESRVLADLPSDLDQPTFEKMVSHYGELLCPGDGLGFENGQLMLGFHHNTPDNTLPIFWYSETSGPKWTPIFRRYPKIY